MKLLTDSVRLFDCILTKGFRSIFIECKARSELEQGFYYKLDNLARQFGINPIAVIVADGYKPEQQKTRGDLMNVNNIWKPEEIGDIGRTIMKLIKGDG